MSPRLANWLAAVVLVGAVTLAWWNSLRAPFLFDDVVAVTDNPSIRRLGTALTPPQTGGTTTGRPLLNLTLALNHAVSGEEVWSYHLFNLLCHAGSTLLLFGLARRTLATPALADRFAATAAPLAFVLALLWGLHPLQTESVTSVAQRSESLCGWFYLLTLYAFVRGATRQNDARWLAGSGLACLAGMACKEVMVTAPVLVWMYDRTFLAGSFAGAWRQRRGYYLGLAATWLLLLWLVMGLGGTRGPAAGLGLGVSVWSNLLTQCEALVLYLRLALWPHPLVADYGTSVVADWTAVWWQGALVLGLLAATAWALVRRPVAGFLGAWFFLILAPSSSVIPLVSQTIAEHRMYLPLAAVLALLAGVAARRLGPRRLLAGGLALGVAAGLGTHGRNRVYLDEQAMWEDVIAKRPGNGRAQNNLGRHLYQLGRVDASIPHFQRAIELDPANPYARFNLGLALLQAGRAAEAEAPLRAAIQIEPSFFYAHLNLGVVLGRCGQAGDALRHFEIAWRYAPWSAEIQFQWGVVLAGLGRTPEAAAHYAECLRLDPARADAEGNWGAALLELKSFPEAIAHLEAALRLKRDQPGIHFNLGLACSALGRNEEAIRHYTEAARLDPQLAAARLNLGIALAQAGRLPEAIDCLSQAAQLRPDDPQVQTNLGIALGLAGRNAEALVAHQAALRLKPDDAQAHYNVGYSLLEAGRRVDARPYFETAVRLQPDFAAAREILARLREGEAP
ncbi:MAG TPA: tetratricopeptide repeat protein [Lacunisphaera sp.]|nr:tetratricopeptide repeat protein [Lacunisphaera sp.]